MLYPSYTRDPGESAIDPEDGDVSAQVMVSGAVVIDVPGTYTLPTQWLIAVG